MLELRRRYGSSAGGGQPSRLPAGYQEVEYIQNIGDSYITLPFRSADIKFKINITEDAERKTMQMGYGGDYMVGIIKNFDENVIRGVLNGTALSIPVPTSDEIVHTVEIRHSDNKLIIDEIEVSYGASFANELSFSVFARTNSSKAPKMKGKMYVLQKDNGVGYTDQYIPCYRTSDRKPGMYDIVNDVFYTNAGTGEFLVGADVGDETNNFEPKLIENLIVETDIVLSHNYEYEIKLSFGDHWSNENGSGLIFGLNSSYYRLFQINGMLYYDINGQNNRAQYTLPDALKTDYFVCKLNNCNIYINDVLVATGTKYNGSISQEGKYLKLFMNTSDPQYAMYSFKGYYDYLKIYNESGELIHELRMRDTTEVWDVVTNKVYPCISLLA